MSGFPNVSMAVRLIGPKEAEAMLSKIYPKQRPLSRPHAARIASDMREGRYRLSPDPIVITEDGWLVNGQHRLRAIVDSGTSQMLVVSEGWDASVYDIMDAGLRRALHLRVNEPWLRHKNGIGSVRATMSGVHANASAKYSEQAVVSFAIEHSDLLERYFMIPGARNLRSAVNGVCIRALLAGESAEVVQRFVSLVYTGVGAAEHENAAIKLLKYLNDPMTRKMAGPSGQSQIYMRAQAALRAFMENRPITKLYAVDVDLWEIPGWTNATDQDSETTITTPTEA